MAGAETNVALFGEASAHFGCVDRLGQLHHPHALLLLLLLHLLIANYLRRLHFLLGVGVSVGCLLGLIVKHEWVCTQVFVGRVELGDKSLDTPIGSLSGKEGLVGRLVEWSVRVSLVVAAP